MPVVGGKGAMDCVNRLTVVGPLPDRRRFARHFRHHDGWNDILKALHIDLLEQSIDRHAWQFASRRPALNSLQDFSLRWGALTFFLDYDQEDRRWKGLARARHGRLRHVRFRY